MATLRIAHIGNPANVANEIAAAQRLLGHEADVIVPRAHVCGYRHDKAFVLPKGLRWLELRGYDVLHLHSFRLLPWALETLLPGKIVLHHHGTDVRLCGEPYGARWAHARLCNYDLLPACPGATAIRLPIDAAQYRCDVWDNNYVLHLEGAGDKTGTRFVEVACAKIGIDLLPGLREFGGHPRSLWLRLMANSTVVVGKVARASGMPGMTCLEAMAMGKPVLAYVSQAVRRLLPGDCPVVSVTPESLEAVLRVVLSSADLRAELGARGQAYVIEHHRPEDVARECLEAYQ